MDERLTVALDAAYIVLVYLHNKSCATSIATLSNSYSIGLAGHFVLRGRFEWHICGRKCKEQRGAQLATQSRSES